MKITQLVNRPLNSKRFLWLIPCLISLVGLGVFISAQANSAAMPEIQSLIQRGEYGSALNKLDTFLTANPRDAQGLFLKSLIYTETGKTDAAIKLLTQLTRDHPELPEPYNNLAVIYAQQNQYEQARAALEAAIRTHPSYTIAYENLGDIYAKLASLSYDKALKLDASNSTAKLKMSLVRDIVKSAVAYQPLAKNNTLGATTSKAVAPVMVAGAPQKPMLSQANIQKPAAKITPGIPQKDVNTSVTRIKSKEHSATTVQDRGNSATTPPDAINNINRVLQEWAAAWSRKDINSYFSYYAPDFKPSGGKSHSAWVAERQLLVGQKPGKISVSFETPNIKLDGQTATVKFRQQYRSQTLNSSTTKTLIMVHGGGKRWLIQREESRR